MAFFQCSFHADTLGRAEQMNVIVPQKVKTQIGMASQGGKTAYPVLYLLHGCSDDHSIWERRTSIERYAAGLPLIIVMPNGDRSYYTNMVSGPRFFDFITEELPQIVAGFFPAAQGRKNTFIAGLSMGGYGALKAALTFPGRYCFAASLSGVTDIAEAVRIFGDRREWEWIFGELAKLPGSEHDLLHLLETAAVAPERPVIRQFCGTEDFLYHANQNFRHKVQSLGVYDYRCTEEPGTHCWEFWDRHIQTVLKEIGERIIR